VREIRTLRARRRELETDSWQAGLRRCSRKGRHSHRKPKGTAPALDPTAVVDMDNVTVYRVERRYRSYHGPPEPHSFRSNQEALASSSVSPFWGLPQCSV
jgi:hypothetical protein